ncbi:hypothetical protein Afil01_52570 [Actinorhabdospora filicis]|uniref:Type II secretion system protein GspF domain-containing protein n=1 Tax=Actinorhabdospora filicis TaxID=1785913 RepID=A0A9W6WD46_9ACTN|nr:type II secretion system F family protein [Actinorhabdospora filicis]GLZ80450.1 hypothetical protein Afil01_52570 [Actinorhabdospora filicis]
MRPIARLRRMRGEAPPLTRRLRGGPWRAATAGLAGLAVLALVGGATGLVLGCVTGVLTDWVLRTRVPAPVLAERRRAAADLPFALDLLSACLAAGTTTRAAVGAVASALDGPLAERLSRVTTALHAEGDTPAAWRPLTDLPGASRLAGAAVRSSGSGAALAGGLRRLAGELRERAALSAEATAERAGVLIVLPLGLCFLPAFVLMGLVPVVAAVLGDVLPA